MSGKTWLLEQVAWVLENKNACLVGYHESKGESDDHLLRAVMDLYRRWLSSPSIYVQAESLFKRHKGKLVSGVGRMFGEIFKNCAPAGGLIQKTFSSLETANIDLKTGGFFLPTLDYDSALFLIRLISEESNGKPVILILDAWEKSPNFQKLYNTIAAFLRHLSDWPQCHIFISFRHPEQHGLYTDQNPFNLASDLANLSPFADLYNLPDLHLSDINEKNSLLTYLKETIPKLNLMDDDSILKMINGYPGVIHRWKFPNQIINKKDDFEKLAIEAHECKYREFKYIFNKRFTIIDEVILRRIVQEINEERPAFDLKIYSLGSDKNHYAVFTVSSNEHKNHAHNLLKEKYEIRINELENQLNELRVERNTLENLLSKIVEKPNVYIERFEMGSTYDVQSQIASLGNGAHFHSVTFTQLWNQSKHAIDLNVLTTELQSLRSEMQKIADNIKDFSEIGAIANAEIEARKGDGPKVLAALSKVGEWSLNVAEKIGVGVATAAIKTACGL